MKHILLPALLLTAGALNAQLYTENFDSYAVGDYIAVEAGPAWVTWIAGTEGTEIDAQVTDEAALSGAQSLKIFGNEAGGPLDVVLVAGLEGAFEVTFNLLIPEGSSGYYNVQENQVPGTAWAFDCFMNVNGTMSFGIDQVEVLTASYTPGEWLKLTHLIDTNSDLMHLYLNDEYVAQLPYDGAQIGGVNFYALGDGSAPLYYVDDVLVDTTDPVVDNVQVVTALDCTFGPNPAQDFVRVQANLDNALVRVLALDGKVVLEERRNDLVGGAQLNLDLDNGIYLLELTNGSQRMTQRLVIQK
ncbi:MAG: T9SS type A sorting domain-containing protein [Flavobacteriales bacterium]